MRDRNTTTDTESRPDEAFESRLIPILRDGIGIVRMILFKELRKNIAQRYHEKESAFASRLTGAVINHLFGTINPEQAHAAFASEHRQEIVAVLETLAHEQEKLRIPLTDAIRTQYLCDRQEGIDNLHILSQAKDLGILIEDREVPMPARFIHLVRTIGVAHGLLALQG